MFNNYYGGDTKNKIKNELKINAVSGGIYKTYYESWFKRFHLKSSFMEKLSDHSHIRYNSMYDEYLIEKDRYEQDNYKDAKPITILQMVICGDMEVIAEIIYTEDLVKYLVSKETMEEMKDE